MSIGQLLGIGFWSAIALGGWLYGNKLHKISTRLYQEHIWLPSAIGFLFSFNFRQNHFSSTGIYLQLLIYLLYPNLVLMILGRISYGVGVTYLKIIVVAGVVVILVESIVARFKK